jgi:hypothetical protein
MLIRNEYGSPVYWRMFNPTDTWFVAGVSEGVVQPGENIGPLSHQAGRFKLELKRGSVFGPFVSSAGAIYNVGDSYVLRSDERLEPDQAVPPTPPATVRQTVTGFDISVHAFPFGNGFPASSFPVQTLMGYPVSQAYGLCGGMAYATRDYFEAGKPIPGTSTPPTGGWLFDYLWQRLLDSFNLPLGSGAPAHYFLLQSPALADAGPPTALGVLSRMGEMVGIQWPRVRAVIDSNQLCPLGLIYHKTADPAKIFDQHQVLAYGYEITGSTVTLLINDPNEPRKEQRLVLDTSDINVLRVSYTGYSTIWAFFATDYVFNQPPETNVTHSWDSGWRSIGRIVFGSEIISMGPSNISIFGRGIENALWWSESSNGSSWNNWTSLGGVITSAPGGASWGPGRMDIFARGGDGKLCHTWRNNGAWSGNWESLGGQSQIVGGPDACSWGPNRLDVFARGTDSQLYHIWYHGNGWSDWQSLGGTLTSDPTAVSWGDGRIDVFARGSDLSLQHIWYDGGGWSNWESLGGILSSSPDAASWGPNRLDVFVRGADGALWTLWYDGTWQGWTSLGGAIAYATDPSSVALGPNRLAVIATGLDASLWIKNYS